MQRVVRLRALWDYLPAFRIVAEHEHLPTASRAIGLSPPALSRAIHLLEEQLGHALFDRSRGRLRLTAQGRHFLATVRVAMRALDEGVDELHEGTQAVRGELAIAFPGEAAPLAAAWLSALASLAPEVVPRQIQVPDVEVALRRGDLDLALVATPPQDDTLSSSEVAKVRWRLVRARGTTRPHPPWRLILPRGAPWPRDQAHVLAAEVTDLGTAALAVSRSTSCCSFLPEHVAAPFGLVRVGATTAITTLYVAHRVAIAEHPRTDAALAALRKAAGLRA
jgi:DNA-binding transcriptional LysR family regulator